MYSKTKFENLKWQIGENFNFVTFGKSVTSLIILDFNFFVIEIIKFE